MHVEREGAKKIKGTRMGKEGMCYYNSEGTERKKRNEPIPISFFFLLHLLF